MTFSLVARCARTGQFGMVVTSSSPCVAARCCWVRARAGAVATQNVTDPGLGALGLEMLAHGYTARGVLEALVKVGEFPDYRQLTVIDGSGTTAHHSGAHVLGRNAVSEGVDCIAAGNLLSGTHVPAAMVAAFEHSAGEHLAERLLRALEGGLAVGGEEGDERSAGLEVADARTWPIADLRVDWHEQPIEELRRVWQVFQPQMQDYVNRALNPKSAPSYGVPGDP